MANKCRSGNLSSGNHILEDYLYLCKDWEDLDVNLLRIKSYVPYLPFSGANRGLYGVFRPYLQRSLVNTIHSLHLPKWTRTFGYNPFLISTYNWGDKVSHGSRLQMSTLMRPLQNKIHWVMEFKISNVGRLRSCEDFVSPYFQNI